MKRRKIRRNPPTKLDFSMAKAGDKYIGEFEIEKPNGEYDVWTIIKRLDPALPKDRPKGYAIYLIGTTTNSGLLSDYYFKPEQGEGEQKALEEINADLEVLARDGESYMSRVKRIPKKISTNRRRGLRRNQMRSHNSMGQKLYVVITADGTPLSGRIGTLEPPGPIFYTKGEAIKKGRMFRGRVVSVESYYKMRPGLRRNPLDSMRVYAGRDGFEITDFKKGDRIEMHPATDLWMRGARYGEIVQVGRKNLKVKLDYLRRAIAVSPRNIGQIVARELSTNRRRGLRRNPMRRTVSKVGLIDFIEDAYYNDQNLPENKKWLKSTLAKIKKLKGGVYDIQVIQNMLRDLRDADRGNNDNYWYLIIDKIDRATGIGPQ